MLMLVLRLSPCSLSSSKLFQSPELPHLRLPDCMFRTFSLWHNENLLDANAKYLRNTIALKQGKLDFIDKRGGRSFRCRNVLWSSGGQDLIAQGIVTNKEGCKI